jgi:hypothetical protein
VPADDALSQAASDGRKGQALAARERVGKATRNSEGQHGETKVPKPGRHKRDGTLTGTRRHTKALDGPQPKAGRTDTLLSEPAARLCGKSCPLSRSAL